MTRKKCTETVQLTKYCDTCKIDCKYAHNKFIVFHCDWVL